MPEKIFKLAVTKFGCIASGPLLDYLLDERAARDDIEIRGYTSGAKLDTESCDAVLAQVISYQPDLVLLVNPNAALPGPMKAREQLANNKLNAITISDGPSSKAFIGKDAEGNKIEKIPEKQGFIIIPCDSMIGARSEFLDPAEMTLFNSDIIRVLSVCGVTRLIQHEVDRVISEIKNGHSAQMPKVIASAETVVESAGFSNPYAKAKAIAALTIAESVSKLTTKGCFKEHDPVKYIPLVAAGHEMMRAASLLADEVREIEKYNDSVLRTPHSSNGRLKSKNKLFSVPE